MKISSHENVGIVGANLHFQRVHIPSSLFSFCLFEYFFQLEK